jgi:hypothetical protein
VVTWLLVVAEMVIMGMMEKVAVAAEQLGKILW